MFNNIFEQILLRYAQSYYMIETNKRIGIDYYIENKPIHRSSCNGTGNLAATIYISDEIYHIIKIPLSEINIDELLSSEYYEYVYLHNNFYNIY